MRLRVATKEERSFFDLFDELASNVEQAAHEFLGLLNNPGDTGDRATRIFEIEHHGDDLTREVIHRLATSFVTPFDREDIHGLTSSLDDVLDHIEAATELIQVYRIGVPLSQMIELAETLAEAASRTASAIPGLRKMKDFDDYRSQIDRLEHEGDRSYRDTLGYLFAGDLNAVDIVKFKDFVEEIEAAIDKLKDVADTVETIYLKHS